MRLKEKAKDARQKQKDSEEQYKEHQLDICGEFLEHALNFPFTARHVNQTDLLEPSFNHFSTVCFSSIQLEAVLTFSTSIILRSVCYLCDTNTK